MWDKLRDELGFGFKRIGELTVALSEEQIPALERLKRQGEDKGVPGLVIWDQARLRREEPNLAPDILAGLYARPLGSSTRMKPVLPLLKMLCLTA